jgi:hypothetical protein
MLRGISTDEYESGGTVCRSPFLWRKRMTMMRKTLGENRIAILLAVFLVGCLLAVTPVAAIHNVSVSIDQPDGPCTDATKCVIFTIDKGVSAGINAFLVSFPDESVCVPSVINPDCIEVSYYDNGAWVPAKNPKDVEVFFGKVPGHPTPTDGEGKKTTTVKIWTPISVPTNKMVRICFLPCSDIEMKKCDFFAWVSTDLEPYDVAKDSDFKSKNTDSLQYNVTIIPNKGGKITARTPPPYDCGDQPIFDITADPGFTICQVCVKKLDSSNDPCYSASACDPGVGTFTYDPKHSTFKFDPLNECWEISATFRGNVTVYLKYQNATADCGAINPIGSTCDFIYSSNNITDALDFVDCLYIGGDQAEFSLDSTKNYAFHPTYGKFMGGTWNDGPPVGEAANINVPSNPNGATDTETFQVTVDLNDGTQVVADPVTITGPGLYPIKYLGNPLTNIVNVENVVGINAGSTCLYQDFFDIFGVDSGTCYGNYGHSPDPAGQWNDGKSLGESVCVDIYSPPTKHCGETYLVTYVGDDGTTNNQATLIIVNDEVRIWWAPQNDHRGPPNIVDILDVCPQMPAWQLHTQCWIDEHPEFEGLIGALIVVDNGIYKETLEMDTPGVVLKAKNKGGAVIDAFGVPPAFNATEFPDGRAGAVFITAGCTELNGFVIKDAGRCNGGSPDIDGNGYMDAAGVVVHPSSWKCAAATIDGGKEVEKDHVIAFPCCEGRVNIINNTIYNSTAEGILANNAVVLVEGNDVYQNCWDGFGGEELKCGVECIDPYAITHCYRVVTEILYNQFHDNGCGKMSSWEGKDCNDQKRVSFSTAFLDPPKNGDPFWIDAGIEIRSVVNCCCSDNEKELDGSDGIDGYFCSECNKEEQALEFSNPFIIGNKINNNAHAGINILKDAVAEGNCDYKPVITAGDIQDGKPCEQHLTILENEIKDNKVFGISSFADPALIIVKYNDIVGNKWWGIKNFVTNDGLEHCEADLLIAKENWWGKIGGPSMGPAPICHQRDERSLALGNGDAVSELVEYNPWLTQPYAVVLKNDPVRWYGSDSLELQAGWNTLSVPLTLDDRADTIMEISYLGKYLTSDNFVIAYQFNANTHLFEPISPNLIPCRGYYIKVKEGTRFPVLYSGSESPGLPTYPLSNGWNLVGSAFGIDKKDNKIGSDEGRWAVANPDSYPRDPESEKPAEEALNSIMSISPRGLSTVISPSVPGQIQTWALTADDLEKKDLYTGEGYWVFMVNPATLSGFEITPFHFEFELPS